MKWCPPSLYAQSPAEDEQLISCYRYYKALIAGSMHGPPNETNRWKPNEIQNFYNEPSRNLRFSL